MASTVNTRCLCDVINGHSKMGILQLPNEVLVNIFIHLDTESKFNLALVCHRFKEVVFSKELWKDYCAQIYLGRSPRAGQGRSSHPSVTSHEWQEHLRPLTSRHTSRSSKTRRRKCSANAGSGKSWPASYFSLIEKRGISKVVIGSLDKKYLEDDIKQLNQQIPSLEEVIFAPNSIDVMPTLLLANSFTQQCFMNVHTVTLNFTNVTWQFIEKLSRCMPQLHTLCAVACKRIGDQCLKSLSTMHRLRILRLSQCEGFSDHGVAALCGLVLGDTPGTSKYADPPYTGLSNLRCLDLGYNPALTRLSLKSISEGNLTSLIMLNISGKNRNYEDTDLQYVAKMKTLKHLTLNGSDFTDEAIRMLVINGSCLKALFMANCRNISSTGLEYISNGLTSVQLISVRGCKNISNRGIQALCDKLPQIVYLDISSCDCVSDSSLEMIGKKLQQLKFLFIYNCPKITSRGFQYLDKNCSVHSSCHISSNFICRFMLG